MSSDTRIFVGRVVGVFGIKGWVKIRSETEPLENIFSYSSLWLKSDAAGTNATEIKFDQWQRQGKGLIAHIEGVDDRNLAAEFVKAEIWIDKQEMPELSEGRYYWHQLIGMSVHSVGEQGETLLGTVANMLETGANDVLVVKPCEGSFDSEERLIPWVLERYILNVDLDRSVIEVDWDPDF